MRSPLMVVVVFVLIIVGGLALATVSSGAGALIAVTGVAGLGAFYVYALIRAARNDPGRIYAPGKARREWKAEQEAARLAEQRKAGRDR
jgi:hypothetical protein